MIIITCKEGKRNKHKNKKLGTRTALNSKIGLEDTRGIVLKFWVKIIFNLEFYSHLKYHITRGTDYDRFNSVKSQKMYLSWLSLFRKPLRDMFL